MNCRVKWQNLRHSQIDFLLNDFKESPFRRGGGRRGNGWPRVAAGSCKPRDAREIKTQNKCLRCTLFAEPMTNGSNFTRRIAAFGTASAPLAPRCTAASASSSLKLTALSDSLALPSRHSSPSFRLGVNVSHSCLAGRRGGGALSDSTLPLPCSPLSSRGVPISFPPPLPFPSSPSHGGTAWPDPLWPLWRPAALLKS